MPRPLECTIDCIRVFKVFDFCLSEVQDQEFFPLATCPTNVAILTAQCSLSAITCTVLAEVQVTPTTRDVTVQVTAVKTVTVINTTTGLPCFTFAGPVTITRTFVLCAPADPRVTCDCRVESSTIECTLTAGPPPLNIPGLVVIAKFCITVECGAEVKLLVQSFGFCKPRPCEELPQEFACDPANLFPSQADCPPFVVVDP